MTPLKIYYLFEVYLNFNPTDKNGFDQSDEPYRKWMSEGSNQVTQQLCQGTLEFDELEAGILEICGVLGS